MSPLLQVDFETGTIVTPEWLDRMQEVNAGLAWNADLQWTPGTKIVTIPAATGNGAACVNIAGKMRWRETTLSKTFSAEVAGTYNVYLTTGSDDNDPSFNWEFRTTGVPSTAAYRLIGQVVWDGAAITNVTRQTSGNSKHGWLHTLANDPLPNASVGTNQLVNSAVTTPKIQNGAVDADKILTAAVRTDKINALAVTEPKIATGAVTLNKIADGAVTRDKLAGMLHASTLAGTTGQNITAATLTVLTGLSVTLAAGTYLFMGSVSLNMTNVPDSGLVAAYLRRNAVALVVHSERRSSTVGSADHRISIPVQMVIAVNGAEAVDLAVLSGSHPVTVESAYMTHVRLA